MLPASLVKTIRAKDAPYAKQKAALFKLPNYNPKTHYVELTKSHYFHTLLTLRHCLKMTSDYFFGVRHGATNVDLFMITPSISSPTGPGSDSIALPIQFGRLHSYLVDSSQFGFEPLLINNFDKVYCYLPSMRGEDYDRRHLNQFFHVEAEVKGGLTGLIPLAEDFIRILCETVLAMPASIDRISTNPRSTKVVLKKIVEQKKFQQITFDAAVSLLRANGLAHLITTTTSGRDITAQGEIELLHLLKTNLPVWLTNYDRDRVPFYQKPDPNNPEKVINADLLFPPLVEGGFGGEIVGSGQRQDTTREMLESLKRQGIPKKSYEWYINLRSLPEYSTTSGFGLGLERFITWCLGGSDIKDAIIYPRLKDVVTFP